MRFRVSGTEKLLLKAAALVDKRGLARRCQEDPFGRVCPVRAMQIQVLGPSFLVPWWEDPLAPIPTVYAEALRAVAGRQGWPIWQAIPRLEDSIMAWSDFLAADTGEVVRTLRGAAVMSNNLTGGRL